MMNLRERILMWGALGLTVAALVVMMYGKLLRNPAVENRKKIQATLVRIDKLTDSNSHGVEYEAALEDYRLRSYGQDDQNASEMARAYLVYLLTLSSLDRNEVSLTPVTGTVLRNSGGRELGWVVRTTGSIDRIVDFLYLVDRDKHVHRIENLMLSRVRRSTQIKVQFKFITVVLRPLPGKKPKPIDISKIKLTADAEDKERRQYAMVSARDIFRPYIKKPPPPVVVKRPTKTPTKKPDPPKPIPPRNIYQVVGLPTWSVKPQIIVREQRTDTIYKFKEGDDLSAIKGRIVMVDYRPMPLPKTPKVISDSRIIVKIGNDYWAVELGQTFDQRYRLRSSQLPEKIRQTADSRKSVSTRSTRSTGLTGSPVRTSPMGTSKSLPTSASATKPVLKKVVIGVDKKEESDVPQ
jgi:hypothetical protein